MKYFVEGGSSLYIWLLEGEKGSSYLQLEEKAHHLNVHLSTCVWKTGSQVSVWMFALAYTEDWKAWKEN